VAKLEDEEAAGFEVACGFWDELAVVVRSLLRRRRGRRRVRDCGLRSEACWFLCGRCRVDWRLLDRRKLTDWGRKQRGEQVGLEESDAI